MIMMQSKILNYNVLLKKEKEGGYTVTVPSLSGCITYGKNVEEAKKMANDAIKAYIISLQKHGEPIPSDETILITTLMVPLQIPSRKTYV